MYVHTYAYIYKNLYVADIPLKYFLLKTHNIQGKKKIAEHNRHRIENRMKKDVGWLLVISFKNN